MKVKDCRKKECSTSQKSVGFAIRKAFMRWVNDLDTLGRPIQYTFPLIAASTGAVVSCRRNKCQLQTKTNYDKNFE